MRDRLRAWMLRVVRGVPREDVVLRKSDYTTVGETRYYGTITNTAEGGSGYTLVMNDEECIREDDDVATLKPDVWWHRVIKGKDCPADKGCPSCKEITTQDDDEAIIRAISQTRVGTDRNGHPYLKAEDRAILYNQLPWYKGERIEDDILTIHLRRSVQAIQSRRYRLRQEEKQ